MRRRLLPFVVVLSLFPIVALFLPAAQALAQTSTTLSTAPGPIYRLTAKSSFEEGCFDPCLCPVHYSDALIGTWRMTTGVRDPLYQVYDITEVNWYLPELDLRVTGRGTYRIGGEFARMHQLTLDLVIGDRAVQHFDSGLVLGGAEFPSIVLTITMNNFVCRDTVFHVAASPVQSTDVVPFTLQDSTYNEGCYGPCDCAVVARPLLGRLGLLALRSFTDGSDYAVLDIRWAVRDARATTAIGTTTGVTGFGLYMTRGATTTATDTARSQRMILDLVEGGKGPTRFDSGVVPAGAAGSSRYPLRVDVDVAENGFACYDNVYSIDARRRTTYSFGTVSPGGTPVDEAP